jgi:hypothetical protein
LDEASSPLPKTAILRSIASRPSQTGQYLIGLDGVDVGAELPDLNRGVADIRLVRRDQKIVPSRAQHFASSKPIPVEAPVTIANCRLPGMVELLWISIGFHNLRRPVLFRRAF